MGILLKDQDLKFLIKYGLVIFLVMGFLWDPVLKSPQKNISTVPQTVPVFAASTSSDAVSETKFPQITSKTVPQITQRYGYTEFSAAHGGVLGSWHNGIDISADFGSPVLSVDDGRVVFVGDQDLYCQGKGYGKYIMVRGSDGYTLLYAHLSDVSVENGDKVSKGERLGKIGDTGLATGPHLHFSVFKTNDVIMTIDGSCGPRPEGGETDPIDYFAS